MFLDKILRQKKIELDKEKIELPLEILKKNLDSFPRRNFKKAISQKDKINIIAEIKKASPSRGVIVPSDFYPDDIAKIYEKNNVSAISILTEREFFKGEIDFIPLVKKVTDIPLLRKDFIIDEYQIYQSRVYGADAILLIVRILSLQKLRDYLKLANDLSLDCLVEVHNEKEMETANAAGAEIIGINNRDLDTFTIDLATTLKLAPLGEGKIIVSESGIKTKDDILHLKKAGVNAFLIGEALMESNDIGAKIKGLQ
ncbi:MAG: indole-3-glycerol phosphate synthase TrpC [bacterium]|nr:indole-3-glycerol phosphate synthase TrpC [bacterium]